MPIVAGSDIGEREPGSAGTVLLRFMGAGIAIMTLVSDRAGREGIRAVSFERSLAMGDSPHARFCQPLLREQARV